MTVAFRSLLVCSIAAAIGGCKKAPARNCDEFEAAQRLLDQISDATLDPTFGDPRYAPALAAFEAIPEDCAQRASAVTIAETIRTAMAKQKSEESARATSPAAPPPPVAQGSAQGADEQVAAEVTEYLRKIDEVPPAPDGSDGNAYAQKLAAEAFTSEEAAEKLEAWSQQAENNLRTMSVPEPCREFHALALENMRQSGELVDDLVTALEAEDRTAAEGLRARKQKLREQEQQLMRMKAELQSRYRSRR